MFGHLNWQYFAKVVHQQTLCKTGCTDHFTLNVFLDSAYFQASTKSYRVAHRQKEIKFVGAMCDAIIAKVLN